MGILRPLPLLAYVDLRPLLFVAGLPVFVAAALAVCRLVGVRSRTVPILILAAGAYAGLFVLLLTEHGPFVGQRQLRSYQMRWQIATPTSSGFRESQVVLVFEDFPEFEVGEHSDELDRHLQAQEDNPVTVVFEIVADYGRVRGFSVKEVAGLENRRSEWSYAGSMGSPTASPWDRTGSRGESLSSPP